MSPPPAPQSPGIPSPPWFERLNVLNMSLVIFILAAIFSLLALRGVDREMDYLGNFWGMLKRFFPPNLAVLPEVWAAFLETVQMAVMATWFAVLLSLPLALGASRNICPRWINLSVRMVLNGIRTIPSLIWAIITVAIIGVSPLAGVTALTFYSVGYLGKFFSDAFETTELEIARGLKAIGAHFLQAIQHGIWPQAKPLIWSHALWMLEYNIRSASIIGYVGAGGLGT